MNKTDYDVIVIGAGISGLVCGCYLAKASMKTLIVEQHSMPGGYCTSFSRKSYKFDTSVHYIGGVRNGALARILEELQTKDELKFNQFDPTDKIIMPDSVTYVRANPHDTIKEFKKSFPNKKKSIEDFFKFIMDSSIPAIYRKTIKLTFKEFLQSFFDNEKLKSAIGILLLCNMGLPPSRLSAFAAIIFFREFLLDPGYYPIGGMQQFADYFAEKFKSYGGTLNLSQEVLKIPVDSSKAKGVIVSPGKEIYSKFVVSAIDATNTFKHLVDRETRELTKVDKLTPSCSIFAVYLGIKTNLQNISNESCNIWFFTTSDLESYYKYLSKNINENKINGLMMSFPGSKDPLSKKSGKDTIEIFTIASYETKEFWAKNREAITKRTLALAEKAIPQMRQYVDLTVTATPFTFQRYTSNRDGAAYGWASTLKQMDTSLFPQATSISNLFLTGHWSIMGAGQGGVSTVALSGKKAAEYIINCSKKNN